MTRVLACELLLGSSHNQTPRAAQRNHRALSRPISLGSSSVRPKSTSMMIMFLCWVIVVMIMTMVTDVMQFNTTMIVAAETRRSARYRKPAPRSAAV
eukprot:4497991-Pyramimonas_sp.AAC.1